ncbi:MAG: hypothetical protein AAFV95_17965 [Bacteroidota bacterium]
MTREKNWNQKYNDPQTLFHVKSRRVSISKKIIEESLLGEKPVVTDEVVEYYRKNPNDLDLIIDKEYFHSRFIKFFFVIGLLITTISRVLKFLFHNTWVEFINDVVLDVFSELGIAIFGGAITAYILERMKQKQYEDNVKFRNEVIDRIKELDKNK